MNKFTSFLQNVFVFLAIFLAVQFVINSFFPSEDPTQAGNLVFQTDKENYAQDKLVTLEIENNTEYTLEIPNECPEEPFTVLQYKNNEWSQKTASPELNCEQTGATTLTPGQSLRIPYSNWNHTLFGEIGRYKIQYITELDGQSKTFTTPEFTVEQSGLFRQTWRNGFYRPIYNGLIFLTSVLPGHYLGFAIILLTLIIRTILLIPSQKAIKSQQKMQEIQPKLEAIREKHKGDQQRIAMETMQVWKEAGVKPTGSCLPLLLQFPFLIAIFYVVRDGLNPDTTYLLYGSLKEFSLSNINTHFLGLDLTVANLYILPFIIGGLQFFQMQLTMARKNKKSGDKKEKNEVAMAQNMMIYIMPVLIAVFTATLPAGVGIYWGTSTTYGIIQQLFTSKGSKKEKNEPQVRVIDSKDK